MARFVAFGTCMEYIASLCVHADSADEAKVAWAEAFKDRHIHPECWDVVCWNLDGAEAHLEQQRLMSSPNNPLWKGHGTSYWSGGYYA